MRRVAVLAGIALLLCPTGPAGARAPWKQRIDRLVGGRSMGVAVGWGDRLVYGRHARVRRPPASNQKLLLSMALLDALGPNARLQTRALARSASDGIVAGNLYVVGRGDPAVTTSGPFARSLGFEPTWVRKLARRIARSGIVRVAGAVIGTTGYFARDWHAPGWKPEFRRLFIALPTALSFQGNASGGRHVVDPERRLARALTRRLESLGVRVRGRPRASRAPRDARTVARVRSQPLRVLLRHTNRTSSNFFAEVLGKRLGVERWGPPGTISRGARAIAAWLRARGVKVHARDSSGLSFDNRVSPRGLVTALRHARRAPWGAVLRGSLAAGGQGTLRDRLRDVRLRAKTGTLEGVSALSGWVWQPRLGRWAEFSILSTGMPKHRAVALEDRIVRVVAEVRPRPARVSALLHRPLVRGDTTGRAGHIRARVAPADEGGYGSPMAFSAFCDTCGRKVYVGERDTPVCPVCSSPLLRAVQVPESRTDEPPDQTSGSK